jgi:hypothetical protein
MPSIDITILKNSIENRNFNTTNYLLKSVNETKPEDDLNLDDIKNISILLDETTKKPSFKLFESKINFNSELTKEEQKYITTYVNGNRSIKAIDRNEFKDYLNNKTKYNTLNNKIKTMEKQLF